MLYCTVLSCTVLTQVVYELYPGIMESLKAINFKVSWSRVTCHASRGVMTRVCVQSSYPVPLTVTDIRTGAGHKTDPALAAE